MEKLADILKLLKEASSEIEVTETHNDGYDVVTNNYRLLSSAIDSLGTIKELSSSLLIVEDFDFTDEKQAEILSQGGNTIINLNGERYTITLLVKNIIKSWDNYQRLLFSITYNLTQEQIDRLSYRNLKIIYTAPSGNEYDITTNEQFRALGDLV